MSDVQPNIYEKLRNVQVELHAPKSQYNSFGKYSYRNVEDILEAVKPILNVYALTIVVSDEVVTVGNRYYVKAHAILKDSFGNQVLVHAYAREDETKKGMDGSQITGAASSYARKYALNGLFAIDDTKDADSSAPPQTAAKAPSKPAEPIEPKFGDLGVVMSPKATAAQIKLMLTAAKRASGLEERNEVIDFFIDEIGKQPTQVLHDEVGDIIKRFTKAVSTEDAG